MDSTRLLNKFLFATITIICVVFIQPAICLSEQPADAAKQTAPRLTFSTNEYNFGTVFGGTIVEHTFLATNTGGQPLKISEAVPECHCTAVEVWPETIQPGKTAEILVQLDTSAQEGEVFKSVSVVSNDPLSPDQTLSMVGMVRKPLEVIPPFASVLLPPEQTSSSTSLVRVVNQTDQSVNLSDPTSSSGPFKATLRTVKPGREFELSVTAVPPLPSGNTAGIISLKTSWTNLPELSITAVARVQPVLEVAPWEVVLPPKITTWTTNLVTITNNAPGAIALSGPKVSDPRAMVELKTIVPGRYFQLAAAFPPGFNLSPKQSVQLSVNSDNASRPVITVPVRQESAEPVTAPMRPSIHHK